MKKRCLYRSTRVKKKNLATIFTCVGHTDTPGLLGEVLFPYVARTHATVTAACVHRFGVRLLRQNWFLKSKPRVQHDDQTNKKIPGKKVKTRKYLQNKNDMMNENSDGFGFRRPLHPRKWFRQKRVYLDREKTHTVEVRTFFFHLSGGSSLEEPLTPLPRTDLEARK